MEQIYQRGRELFFTDGEPLSNYTRFRIDVAQGSLATVEVFQSSGEMHTFELVPEPPTAIADKRLEGCQLFGLGTGFHPNKNTYVTEAQAFVVLNGTLRRNPNEDISRQVSSEERAQSRINLDQWAMEQVLNEVGHRLLPRREMPSPDYKQVIMQTDASKEEVDRVVADAVRRTKRKQVPQFQFVRNPARARKHAMQALSLDQSQYHSTNKCCGYCGSQNFNSGPNHDWSEAHCDRCGREVAGELLEAIQVAITPKCSPIASTAFPTVLSDRHSSTCASRINQNQRNPKVDDNKLEPGKAKFIGAPKGTILRINIEVSGRRTTIAQTMGHAIVLPSIPLRSPGHIHRVTIKAHHPDGLQSHERHCHPANYRALQKDGFVHQLAWNNPDLGDVVREAKKNTLTAVDPVSCPECKGTWVYNCPFKGPVPCSLCPPSSGMRLGT